MSLLRIAVRVIIALLVLVAIVLAVSWHRSCQSSLSLFPIEHYSQRFNDWIDPKRDDYKKRLLSSAQQQQRYHDLVNRYVGEQSPWNDRYISNFLAKPASHGLAYQWRQQLKHFSNRGKGQFEIGYGENFRPHTEQWLYSLEHSVDLNQFQGMSYEQKRRGIAVVNVQSRVLPTHQVHFYDYHIPGEGFPFDNLQQAVVWAGSPLYILAMTKDKSWYWVLTPNVTGWVPSSAVAFVNDKFIDSWTQGLKHRMMALIRTAAPLIDDGSQQFAFKGYIGMLLPAAPSGSNQLMIPVADANRNALIRYARVRQADIAAVPLRATMQNFIQVMRQLIGRPYGWGGAYFFNDCSSELKNIFAVFGVWLPMHSSNQVDKDDYAIKVVDLSSASLEQRLAYLAEQGNPFTTIIYTGGHVFLYLGCYVNPDDKNSPAVPLSYQNIWALHHSSLSRKKDVRVIIGKAVLLPLLPDYSENKTLISPANKAIFKVGFL